MSDSHTVHAHETKPGAWDVVIAELHSGNTVCILANVHGSESDALKKGKEEVERRSALAKRLAFRFGPELKEPKS